MDFERRINRHRNAVYRQLVRMCGNHEDAEDAFVEALTAAFKAKSGLRDENAMQAWLVQIGRRACGRVKREESKHSALQLHQLEAMGIEIPDDATSAETLAMESELKSCILTALDTLKPIYKQAYELVDVGGLSPAEAALQLGLTVENVKVRVFRARTMIREKIDQMVGEIGG